MASLEFLRKRAWWVRAALVAAACAIAFVAWQLLKPKGLPEGFASGNGRIEATEVDVDAKIAERIRSVLVHEGDLVRPGQLLVQMDTDVLTAQRREAEAQLQSALVSIATAQSQLAQRRAEKNAAIAVIAQRKAELDAAQNLFLRTQALASKDFVTVQALDNARADFKSAEAAVSAAKPQLPTLLSVRPPPKSLMRGPRWTPHERPSSAFRRILTTASFIQRWRDACSTASRSRARSSQGVGVC